jgi:hypothetical protein
MPDKVTRTADMENPKSSMIYQYTGVKRTERDDEPGQRVRHRMLRGAKRNLGVK